MVYPEWKQFERLVARIEATLVPKGGVVHSPDRIPDLYTGSLREVDGSIRFNVGSASILITLESRRRGVVQDDTWIEQLSAPRVGIRLNHPTRTRDAREEGEFSRAGLSGHTPTGWP